MSSFDIRCGDAIDLIKDIPDNSVNLIIADPPYNLGKDYGNNHDLKGFEEYLDFTNRWVSEAKRPLTEDGTIYVFMGVRFISYLYDILDRKNGLYFNSWSVWHYTQAAPYHYRSHMSRGK